MTQADSDEQLGLFPFCSVARTSGEFLLNLSVLSKRQDGGEFTVKLPNTEEREKFFERALAIGAHVSLRGPCKILTDALIAFTEREDGSEGDLLLCKECGAPAIYYIECSCGTYVWCKEHEDSSVFFNHADHICSPECCKRGHTAERISSIELEASIPMVEVSVEEQQPAENEFIFTVKVRRKSDEEYLQELEWLMMNYSIEELDGKLKSTIECNLPPLEIGQRVMVTPHFMSSPTLALAVVRLNHRLVAQVVGKNSDWDYVLLLPEDVAIPGHSTLSDNGGRHKVILSRSEIEPVSQ